MATKMSFKMFEMILMISVVLNLLFKLPSVFAFRDVPISVPFFFGCLKMTDRKEKLLGIPMGFFFVHEIVVPKSSFSALKKT